MSTQPVMPSVTFNVPKWLALAGIKLISGTQRQIQTWLNGAQPGDTAAFSIPGFLTITLHRAGGSEEL